MSKLKAVIDIEYNENGVGLDELRSRLSDSIQHLFGEGAITGETEAEVDSWNVSVEKVPEKPKTEITIVGMGGPASGKTCLLRSIHAHLLSIGMTDVVLDPSVGRDETPWEPGEAEKRLAAIKDSRRVTLMEHTYVR